MTPLSPTAWAPSIRALVSGSYGVNSPEPRFHAHTISAGGRGGGVGVIGKNGFGMLVFFSARWLVRV